MRKAVGGISTTPPPMVPQAVIAPWIAMVSSVPHATAPPLATVVVAFVARVTCVAEFTTEMVVARTPPEEPAPATQIVLPRSAEVKWEPVVLSVAVPLLIAPSVVNLPSPLAPKSWTLKVWPGRAKYWSVVPWVTAFGPPSSQVVPA